ncbi:MAG: dienelactone hydrolase family protein [Opitutales bacterium]|jgi:carboxymethylenebutenolidase
MKLLPWLLLALLPLASPAQTSTAVSNRLNNSPRHHEWVTVLDGPRKIQCFVAYPEVKDRAPAIVIVHEVFGLSDWVRSAADQLAENGYIAIVPDLLSGMGPNGGGTSAYPSQDAVIQAVFALPLQQVHDDLDAVANYVSQLPSCSGTVAVAGFCWGGGTAFRYASQNKNLKAAYVFYGPPPAADDMAKIACPVYGFYGENDARISTTVPATITAMKAAGKTYQPVIYAGAGHGFMRAGMDDTPTPANHQAMLDAWKRWLTLLPQLNPPPAAPAATTTTPKT